MSLNKMASDPHATNGSAKDEDEAEAEAEAEARVHLKDVGVEGLIAQPAHWLRRLINRWQLH